MTNAIALTRKINKRDKYIPGEWLEKLYNAIDNARDKAYIMFHAETGLRVSDVLGVETARVDWQQRSVRIWDFKKDEERDIVFPEKVKSVLKMWLKQRQAEGIKGKELFPFSEKTANRILKRWCKKIGFPFAHLVATHWLRHTFIRLSRKANRDIKFVQQQTGDTVKTILEWYSELSTEDMRLEADTKPLFV